MMTALLLPTLATLTLATKKVLPHKVLPDFFLTGVLLNTFYGKAKFHSKHL
jgi:hypothetical protein